MYITYRCQVCGTEFIMPTETLSIAEKEGRYIACPLGHKHVVIAGRFDDLKECMEAANTYERRKGSIRQIRYK